MEIYRESWETSVGNICTNLRKQILGGKRDTKRGEKLRAADDMIIWWVRGYGLTNYFHDA